MRKKYHRKLMRLIHEVNRSIRNDPLFLGRFEIGLRNESWECFDDNSGGILYCTIRAFDKETRQYRDYFLQYAPYFSTIRWKVYSDIMNDFIVERSDFWKERPKHTIYNAKDYRNRKVDWDQVYKAPRNYFITSVI